MIEKNTPMLLFRYKDYKKNDFIEAHKDLLIDNGYVWMLKVGKRTSIEKIEKVIDAGGWLVLRSPKSEGSKSYMVKFCSVIEEEPEDGCFPEYYDEILDDEDGLYFESTGFQWFKLQEIVSLDDEYTDCLVMQNTGKKVNDVIDTTRTAVMFIKNEKSIDI